MTPREAQFCEKCGERLFKCRCERSDSRAHPIAEAANREIASSGNNRLHRVQEEIPKSRSQSRTHNYSQHYGLLWAMKHYFFAAIFWSASRMSLSSTEIACSFAAIKTSPFPFAMMSSSERGRHHNAGLVRSLLNPNR
jgi:hypothetical protein